MVEGAYQAACEGVGMNLHKRVYSDGRVRWRARYPDPTRGGKKQIERQFETKREAEKWLTSQKSSIQRGDHIDPKDKDRLVGEVADTWRATWLDLEPKTQGGLRVHLEGACPAALAAFHRSRVARGDSRVDRRPCPEREPNTVRRIYAVLRAVLKVAVERRY